MSFFEIVAAVLTLSAVFAYINHRFIGLPTTVGVMAVALAASLVTVVLGWAGVPLREPAQQLLAGVDFNEAVLHGMLGFLLFAGALHVELGDLAEHRLAVGVLATVGVAVSTAVVGLLMWLALPALGLPLRLIDCLLFGALISPTDPIAVLGILKTSGAPKSLETKVAGESLFNDGIGVVVFLLLLQIGGSGGGHNAPSPSQSQSPSPQAAPAHSADQNHGHGHGGEDGVGVADAVKLLAQEAVGGALLGLALGYVTFRLLRSINNYQVELLLTIALAAGGYALAERLHMSAPIAIVVAGLLIGNQGRALAMSAETREHLDTFWELVDEVLNAVLFALIGLEVLVLPFSGATLAAGLLAVPITLAGRWISVAGAVSALRRVRPIDRGAIRVLTWGGLRGGISVAMALSLPTGPARETLLVITYAVVVFSILVQGLTISSVIRASTDRPPGESAAGGGGAAHSPA
jgi:CPA1 family monovalent cation:H+ antiporter